MPHPQIAQRAFNAPLLVEPSKAQAFLAGLGPRILGGAHRLDGLNHDPAGIEAAARPARASILGDELGERVRRDGAQPFALRDGIAVIEVTGALIHRGAWIGKSSGQTSYEGIMAQIEAAAADEDVRGIALDIDSFGGEVAGVFGLADRIRALRAVKPVRAFVAEHAYSAAYALAAQADRIVIPRTGGAGSIGVVVMHADFSGMLDSEGVRVRLIHSGAHKVDGNPFAPLPEEVAGRIQAEIDGVRTLFAETVGAGRGARLSAAAALATEAATFTGQAAIEAGLADALADARDRLQALRILIGLGVCANVRCQVFDPALCINQLVSQQAQRLACGSGQVFMFTSNNQTLDIVDALWDDDSELTEMRTHGIHDLGLLAHQKFPRVAPEAHLRCDVRHQPRLCVLALHGNKPHGRARYRFADRLRIGLVGLAALDVALHVAGLHEPDIMPELEQLARPVVRAGAGFQADEARRLALEEFQHLAAAQLTAQ